MSSSSAAGLAAGASVYEQITEFARRHNNEFIVIAFVPDSNGNTPPQLSGSLRVGLVYPDAASRVHYDQVYCLPDSKVTYQSIMTSKDGTAVSGSFHPDPNADTADDPAMLRRMLIAATASTEALRVEAARGESERQALAGAAHVAADQREELLRRSQAADAERATALAHRQYHDSELQRAQAERDSATQQRQRLADEADRAADQRDELMNEVRAAQADRLAFRDELVRLRQELHQSSAARNTFSPSPDQDANRFIDTMERLSSTLRDMRSTSPGTGTAGSPLLTIREAHPYVTSHGQHVCPMIDPETARRLSSAEFEPYRWLKTATAIGTRIRLAMSEISLLLHDDLRFPAWADRVGFTLTPMQWCIYTTGSQQCRLELCASLRLNDHSLHSVLVFARQRGADPAHIPEYVSGSMRVNDVPLLGSHNGVTNTAVLPAAVHARPAANANANANGNANANPNANRNQGRGGAGGGRGGRQARDPLRGGGGTPEQELLAALNALVRI